MLEQLYKSNWFGYFEGTLQIFLALCALGVFVIPITHGDELSKKGEKTKANKGIFKNIRDYISRLTPWGWRLFACTAFSGILGFIVAKLDSGKSEYDSNNNLKTQFAEQSKTDSTIFAIQLLERAAKDSIKNALRDSIFSMRFNDSIRQTNSLVRVAQLTEEKLQLQLELSHKENMQLQKEFNSPYLTCHYNDENPRLSFDSSRSHLVFTLDVENSGKGRADIIDRTVVFISHENNQYSTSQKIKSRFRETFPQVEEGRASTFYLSFDTTDVNSTYLAIEYTYTNVLKEKRPPFRAIFQTSLSYIGKPVPITPDDDYHFLSDLLIERGIWTKL